MNAWVYLDGTSSLGMRGTSLPGMLGTSIRDGGLPVSTRNITVQLLLRVMVCSLGVIPTCAVRLCSLSMEVSRPPVSLSPLLQRTWVSMRRARTLGRSL